MGLPEFKSCCCCISLRFGTLILGYLHLIMSVLGFVVSVVGIVYGIISIVKVDIQDGLYKNEDGRNMDIAIQEAIKLAGITLLAIGIIFFILCIVQTVFVIFLLVGGHNGKPALIKAYVVYSVVMLVITFILNMVSVVVAPSFSVIPNFFFCAFETYFLLVIRSYMVKLRDNPEGDRTAKV